MISTLIRSNISSNNLVPKGTSEYLVNTESNKIIYPYTLAENILQKDENGELIPPTSDGNIMLPGFNGLMDQSRWFNKFIEISNVYLTHATRVSLYSIDMEPGVYFIEVFGNLVRMTPNLPADVGDHCMYLYEPSIDLVHAMTPVWIYRGGNARFSVNTICRIAEQSSIYVQFMNISNNTTLNFANLFLKYLKFT